MELSEHQEEVREFVEQNSLEAAPGFRVLDLVSEVGELVKDVTKTSEYGSSPADMELDQGELGDVLFSVLAVASAHDLDAEEALESALDKYRSRIEEGGDPGSGSHS